MDLTLSQSGGIPKGQADVTKHSKGISCLLAWPWYICAPLRPKTNMKNETSKSEVQFKQYRMSNSAVSESFNQIMKEKNNQENQN